MDLDHKVKNEYLSQSKSYNKSHNRSKKVAIYCGNLNMSAYNLKAIQLNAIQIKLTNSESGKKRFRPRLRL